MTFVNEDPLNAKKDYDIRTKTKEPKQDSQHLPSLHMLQGDES
jgi:hypothetical protein